MASIGIVRRIDELGRIVIPKEIRKTLRIQNGDNLEISLENENIVLKKSSSMNGIENLNKIITETLFLKQNYQILICDTAEFLSISGQFKKKYLHENISIELINCLKSRTLIKKESIELVDGEEIKGNFLIHPILVNGDVSGLILFLSENQFSKEDENIIQITSQILSKYLEE